MNYVTAALTLILAAAMVGGCGDDGGTTMDGSTADSSTTIPDAGPGETLFYVASVLGVGQADPTGDPSVVPGFNLDGLVSDAADPAGCLHADFTSPAPDNQPGVDNQLGPILSSVGSSIDVEGSLSENILDGSLLLLFELVRVNDRVNDPEVGLNIYVGQMPAGVDEPADLDGDAIIDPDQTFDIDPASLEGGEPLVSVSGALINGRVNAGPIDIEINLPIEGGLLLNIRDAEVRLSIAGDTITAGIIGGALDVAETVMTIVAIDPDAIPESLARSVLDAQADLVPDETGACTAVSVGLTFEGITAVRGGVGM
ncbi:MAG: hypothetical protein JRH11_07900 [Deltaproteobacteria bacterium]|nr:hypothetical protein [Deltaproteobacteria bacterium]